jgi:hypothetical protein
LPVAVFGFVKERRRRSKLTPLERAKEDEDVRRIPGDW